MATQIQRRGGSTTDHETFVGADREITVDTDKKTLVVHDGQQEGGYPLARENLSNVKKEDMFLKLPSSEVFNKGCPVGVVFPYVGQNAPPGFLLLNGSTLGALGSGADLMGEEYKPLYEFLWNNMADAEVPVSDGRGSLAVDDWLANKTLQIPKANGRFILGAGQGENLTERTIGSSGGTETHLLSVSEMPAHNHTVIGNDRGSDASQKTAPGLFSDDAEFPAADVNSITHEGGDQPHNNMPPWLALTWIIKY